MLQYSSHEAVYLETRSLEDWESKNHYGFDCVVMIFPTPLESACSCWLMKSRDSAVTLIVKILVRDVVKKLDVRCYSIRQSQSFFVEKTNLL